MNNLGLVDELNAACLQGLVSLIPSQQGLFKMSPGVRRWSGAEEATGCRLLASPPYLLRSGQA